MSAEPIAESLWRLTTPMPFRPRRVHAYLAALGEGRFMLVDGGLATDEAWSALDAGVREVAGSWSHVVVHVITHMHMDHIGLVPRAVEAGAARPAMGRLDAERARHAAAEPEEEAEYRLKMLGENGAPEPFVATVQAGLQRAAQRSGWTDPGAALDGDGGALPDAEGWTWIPTPGHTAGHVSLFRAADRVLIAGDAILPRITPTLGINRQRDDPVGDQLRTLGVLKRLDASSAWAGHGEVILDPARRIAELRADTVAEGERIHSLLGEHPRSAWEVAMARHPAPDLPEGTRMLALRETRAHLDRLVSSGRAARLDRPDGRVEFVPA
jgi:glyoxylase-like metal-dependent hydrolase (beta-lactamase superfamily II)